MNSEVKSRIGVGSTVTLHLALTLADGMVAESTFDDEPLTFTMGDGALVHGLELALYGLFPGDVQRLELSPEQAFGLHDPDNVHQMLRAEFDSALELQPGVIIEFETQEGDAIPGMVLSFNDEYVELDFNHPLAGYTIIFDVEIINVVPAAEVAEPAGEE
ncbi:MAG: FKBP-type peptidyl-prolyl cis-trans isomerase [Gammaproteobacteria bacterium]